MVNKEFCKDCSWYYKDRCQAESTAQALIDQKSEPKDVWTFISNTPQFGNCPNTSAIFNSIIVDKPTRANKTRKKR